MATSDDDLDAILAQALGGFRGAEPTVAAPVSSDPVADESDALPAELMAALQSLTAPAAGGAPDLGGMQQLLAQLTQSLDASSRPPAAVPPAAQTPPTGASARTAKAPAADAAAGDAGDAGDDLNLEALSNLLQRAAQLEGAAAAGAEVGAAEMKQLEELMQSLMSGLGAEGAEGNVPRDAGEGGEVPDELMQTMMGTLLSKDIIYPSLVEVSSKYVPWLAANTAHPEFARFSAQHACVLEICAVYENTALDTPSQTRAVMALMEKMQAHGTPPEEVIANAGGFGLGGGGMPFDLGNMASVPGSCSLM